MHICTYTMVIGSNLHNRFVHITTNDENGSAAGLGFAFDQDERLRSHENKRLSTSRKVLFILLHGYWIASDT